MESFTIDPDLCIRCLDSITWHANHTFHEVFMNIKRIMEHNHVPPPRLLEEVNNLIDQYVFTGMEVRFHALPICAETLYR